MKLNRLLKEAVPPASPIGQPAPTLAPGMSQGVDPNIPSEEDLTNPLGARLPQAAKKMDPTELRFRYDINKEYEISKQAEKQADSLFAAGDAENAVRMLKDTLHRYHEITDRHALSGLREKSFQRQRQLPKERHDAGQFSGYFVLAGDIDKFRWINSTMTHAGADRVLYEIGELFDKSFEQNPKLKGRVKTYHPHGDELAVFAYALDEKGNTLTFDQSRAILIELVNGAKGVTTELAGIEWQVPGRKRGVQVTMSWALSTTYDLADDILMRVKGESDKTRFLLTIDETLAQHYQLPAIKGLLDPLGNFQVKQIEPTIRPMMPQQADAAPGVQSQPAQPQQPEQEPTQTPAQAMENRARRGRVMSETGESKAPNQKDELAFMETHQGMAFLQCNPYKFTDDDTKIIQKTREKQLGYLKDSTHIHPLTGAKLDAPYTDFKSRAGGGKTSQA